MAQCKTFPSPERCSERWSVLSAATTRRIAVCQKTGYPDPRQHFCTQRPGSAASLAQGHSIRGGEEGVTATSFRSSGRWEPSALRQSRAISTAEDHGDADGRRRGRRARNDVAHLTPGIADQCAVAAHRDCPRNARAACNAPRCRAPAVRLLTAPRRCCSQHCSMRACRCAAVARPAAGRLGRRYQPGCCLVAGQCACNGQAGRYDVALVGRRCCWLLAECSLLAPV